MSSDKKLKDEIERINRELLFYKEALNASPNPIFLKNSNAQFIFFNKSYESFFGVNREDLIGTTVEESTHLDEKDKFRYHIEDMVALENQSSVSYEDEFVRGDGQSVPALYWSNGFLSGEDRGLIGEIVDIDKVRSFEKKLINSMIGSDDFESHIGGNKDDVLQFYTTVLNYYQSDRILIFDFDYDEKLIKNAANFRRVNDKIVEDALLPAGSLSGMVATMPHLIVNSANYVSRENYVVEDELAAAFLANLDSIIYMILVENDTPIGITVLENPKSNTDKLEIIQSTGPFIIDDLGKNKLFDRITHLNYIDRLTNVHNRTKYNEDIQEFIKDKPKSIGIVSADVNGLSTINKHYGEENGDSILKICARILNDVFKDEVYRIGDDEFIVLATDIDNISFDSKVALLNERIKKSTYCNLSFGYTFAEGKYDVLSKIEYSNELLQVEKQSYYKEFSSDEARILNYSRHLTNNLIREINEGRFTIFLQPQVELSTGEVFAAEALVRKYDDENNIISPHSFLPRYEGEKVIRHIDLFVVEEVVKTLASWKERGIFMSIALNLSRVTLMERDIIDIIKNICDRYGVSRGQIEIEVTETSNRIEGEQLKGVLQNAIKEGFLVSLDDFGSEYSNLLMITSAEFSQIKFDKSLIDNICTDIRAYKIVEYAIKMCAELGITNMLAEGIESKEQAELLSQINCKYGQGYYYAKPMSVKTFEQSYFKGEN